MNHCNHSLNNSQYLCFKSFSLNLLRINLLTCEKVWSKLWKTKVFKAALFIPKEFFDLAASSSEQSVLACCAVFCAFSSHQTMIDDFFDDREIHSILVLKNGQTNDDDFVAQSTFNSHKSRDASSSVWLNKGCGKTWMMIMFSNQL